MFLELWEGCAEWDEEGAGSELGGLSFVPSDARVVRRARCCGREGPEEVWPLRGDEGSFR